MAITMYALGYVVGEVDDRRLSDKHSAHYKILLNHLRQLGDLSRGSSFTPLVWCRLAIQFWLENGGRQEKFITAMTRWVRKKNKGVVAFVSYKCSTSSGRLKMPLEAFLFGGSELPDLINTEWAYKHRSGTHIQQPKAKSKLAGNRSDEDQVGSHLLPAVKNAVQELSNTRKGRGRFLKKPDPKTEKFRYEGKRDELYEAIYEISPDISGKRQLKDGRYKEPYTKHSVIKAISMVAICRRSWAK